ncbi:MAG: glycosyltransferase family 9 protein [Acidobacteriota bacterium]|nr:glycosyltransferase family 9 protein [Acidobacteriota bacterium]
MTLPFDQPPESICILRLSAIGDITHMVPVVRTLQKVWPQTRITWIIGSIEASLLKGLPNVEFIPVKKAGLATLFELRRILAGRKFDILLHMQVAMRASILSLAVKAPVRLGFDKQRARDNQGWFTNRRIAYQPEQHVLDGFFGFLQTMGIQERVLQWDIPLAESDRRFAEDHLGEGPFVVINPCTSVRNRNYRNWRAERYARVADHAATEYGAKVVLTGGPADNEKQMAAEIRQHAETELIDLVGKTTLKQLLAVLTRADLVISPDTGPAHMATAAGTPVIGLYVTSNPRRTGPYLSADWTVDRYPEALRQELNKSVEEVSWGKRVRNPNAVDLITVEDVTRRLDRFFNS